MAGSKREIYEAGRTDERSEIVGWLRGLTPRWTDDRARVEIAEAIERGDHLEVEVPGDVGR